MNMKNQNKITLFAEAIRLRISFVITFVAASISNGADPTEGIPTWEFNILFGSPLIIKGRIDDSIEGENNWSISMPDKSVVRFVSKKVGIEKILYCDQTVLRDSRFLPILTGDDTPLKLLQVYIEGDDPEVNLIPKDGIYIIYLQDAFGIYLLNPSHQSQDKAAIMDAIQRRRKIHAEWNYGEFGIEK